MPPPLPSPHSNFANPGRPGIPKRAVFGCLAVAGALFVGFAGLVAFVVWKSGKDFRDNRPAILSEARAASERNDFVAIEALRKKFALADDKELDGILDEAESRKAVVLSKARGQIHRMSTLASEDQSKGGRKRHYLRIYAPTAQTRQDVAATLIHAAKSVREQTGADVVTVQASVHPDLDGKSYSLGWVDYIPDGKGTNAIQRDFSDGKIWQVKIANRLPSKEEVQVARLWEKGTAKLTEQLGEDAWKKNDELFAAIAAEMKISSDEVKRLKAWLGSPEEWPYDGAHFDAAEEAIGEGQE